MNDTTQAAIDRWLDDKWRGQATCPAGHSEWAVAENLSFMPGFVVSEAGPKIAHDRGFTFVVLTCTTCGYVALVDTGAVGLSS